MAFKNFRCQGFLICCYCFWRMKIYPLLMVKTRTEGIARCEGRVGPLTAGWPWVASSTQVQAELAGAGPPCQGPTQARITAQCGGATLSPWRKKTIFKFYTCER